MQHNLAPILCFPTSVVPRLQPEKHLSDLFLPDEYLGYGQRGLDRQNWYQGSPGTFLRTMLGVLMMVVGCGVLNDAGACRNDTQQSAMRSRH